MPEPDFTKPLQATALIDLFPKLLEELGLHEPESTMRYVIVERELLKAENEEDLLEHMGFYPYVPPHEAKASGDEEQIATAEMQQHVAKLMRDEQFLFFSRTLEDNHYLRQAGSDAEYMIYVAREEPVLPIKKFLAKIAGLQPGDIDLRRNIEYPSQDIAEATASTQYENFLMLTAMAEGALRRIKPDGTPYVNEKAPFSDDQIATRAFMAAEEIWIRNGGNANLIAAYRQAYILGDLTRMARPENDDFNFGAFEPRMVERTRQRIAYAILTGRRTIGMRLGDDMGNLKPLPLPIMIRNAAALLNGLVAQEFDGDLDKHTKDINLVARYMDDCVTMEDRAALEELLKRKNLRTYVALAYLQHLVSGYANICAASLDAQEKRTPTLVLRALDTCDAYLDITMDNGAFGNSNLPVVRHHEVGGPPDRSMRRLERFIPPDGCKPH